MLDAIESGASYKIHQTENADIGKYLRYIFCAHLAYSFRKGLQSKFIGTRELGFGVVNARCARPFTLSQF